jgi:hypothetical protein
LLGDDLRRNARVLRDTMLRRILLDAKLRPHREKRRLTAR